VSFQFFTAVYMSIPFFWDIMLHHGTTGAQHFKGMTCLIFCGQEVLQESSNTYWPLKMKAVCSFKILHSNYPVIHCHISQE
jgi:hypothetical protein